MVLSAGRAGGLREAATSILGDVRQEPLDRVAEQVRDRYPSARGGSLLPLGNSGGFSGARLWRGEGKAGPFCLRAWPVVKNASSVRRLHQLMAHARNRGLDFVPAVRFTDDGDTIVEAAGRVWELTEWLPGRADFSECPSPARLDAAAEALGRLHLAWEAFAGPPQPCPAIRRRLQVLADWRSLVASGWGPLPLSHPRLDLLRPVTERAWRGLPRWLTEVARSLGRWSEFCRPVQPCLCDLWHDHLLFDGNRLTGLLDYGAVKNDHVAVDLARMLGSLVEDAPVGWERGLRAYRRLRPLDEDGEQLARVLDRTGIVLGVSNWLRWLYHEGRPYEDLAAVARRLDGMLNRIESWGDLLPTMGRDL
jgi:Ser/Thr protein kinase RdoA (MazF antagonist)